MALFKKYTFKGGVHPDDRKNLSSGQAIEIMPPPKIAYIPVQQHIGAPATILVKPGDEVKKGQLIAQASGVVSANIHSSINGIVKKIENLNTPIGRKSQTIIIERNDESETDFDEQHIENLDKKYIIEKIKEAGIVGLGGATFPTHVKLSPPPGKSIDTLIINGAECEPYLTCDYRIMIEKTEDFLKGVMLLKTALEVDNVYIGIEKNKPDAIHKLTEATANLPIKVIGLEVKYPQGAEKQLIYAILKKEVPSGGLPLDVGVVVQNVGTAYAIYEAIYKNKNLYERVLTVSGEGIKNPKNLLVRIGTPIAEVIEYCGGLKDDTIKVINGGPMMGIAIFDLNVPVIKGTSGILALTKEQTAIYEEHNCISCGRCVDVCPMNLVPTMIMKNIKKDFTEETEKYGAMDCIECGSCAYVCPAKINLVHYIRLAKSTIIANRRKAQQTKGASNG